jgi:hypothetical protein
MECATALYTVQQAHERRSINIVLLDPNCRTKYRAMSTIEASMTFLFHENSHNVDDYIATSLLIQAHSAAGEYMVRYLKDHDSEYLKRIQAISFTDSTHSIEWSASNNNGGQQRYDDNDLAWRNLLQSDRCVYFCSSNPNRDRDWHLHKTGERCCPGMTASSSSSSNSAETWKRRFGTIRTMWAGTPEHSLCDWFARHEIWKHFDAQLSEKGYRQRDEDESCGGQEKEQKP